MGAASAVVDRAVDDGCADDDHRASDNDGCADGHHRSAHHDQRATDNDDVPRRAGTAGATRTADDNDDGARLPLERAWTGARRRCPGGYGSPPR
jgi:hypothetical protein